MREIPEACSRNGFGCTRGTTDYKLIAKGTLTRDTCPPRIDFLRAPETRYGWLRIAATLPRYHTRDLTKSVKGWSGRDSGWVGQGVRVDWCVSCSVFSAPGGGRAFSRSILARRMCHLQDRRRGRFARHAQASRTSTSRSTAEASDEAKNRLLIHPKSKAPLTELVPLTVRVNELVDGKEEDASTARSLRRGGRAVVQLKRKRSIDVQAQHRIHRNPSPPVRVIAFFCLFPCVCAPVPDCLSTCVCVPVPACLSTSTLCMHASKEDHLPDNLRTRWCANARAVTVHVRRVSQDHTA